MLLPRTRFSTMEYIFVLFAFMLCIATSLPRGDKQTTCSTNDECDYERTGSRLLECCDNNKCCNLHGDETECSHDEDCNGVVNVFMPSISLPRCCKNEQCCSEIVYQEELEEDKKENYPIKFKTAVVGAIATVFVLLLLVSLSCVMLRQRCNEESRGATRRRRFILRFSDLQFRPRLSQLQNQSRHLASSCPAYIGNTVTSNDPQNLPSYENVPVSSVSQQESEIEKDNITPPKYEDLFKNDKDNPEPPRYEDLP